MITQLEQWVDLEQLKLALGQATRSALRFGADRELIHYFVKVVFKFDSGGADRWIVTDAWALLHRESQRVGALKVFRQMALRLRRFLTSVVFVKDWWLAETV